eukprot:11660108-Alexandrium_andersonii.AAC.1
MTECAFLPGDASRKGARYLAADGGRVPNLGEGELGFTTKEQHRCRIKFQAAAAKRPLLVVSTLTKAGKEVRRGDCEQGLEARDQLPQVRRDLRAGRPDGARPGRELIGSA